MSSPLSGDYLLAVFLCLWLLVWSERLTEKVQLMSNRLKGPTLYTRAVSEEFQWAFGS